MAAADSFEAHALWRKRAFFALFLFACAAAFNLQRLVDPDLFWHLRGGEDIIRMGRAALPDSWNYLFSGKVWVNQQWLTEVLMALAFKAGGYWGLTILRTLVGLGCVLFLLGALKKRPAAVRYLTVAVFVACNAKFFLFRTHTFSFLGMAALLFLLERLSPLKRLPWVILLFAVWANLHAFFGLGLLVLGIWVVANWWINGHRFVRDTWIDAASVPLASAATLINPFGYGVWETAIATLGHTESYLVTEWWPVWRYPFMANANFYFLVALIALLAVFWHEKLHWPSLAASGTLLAMGVRSVRLTSAFTLPAMPLLAGSLEEAFEWWNRQPKRREAAKAAVPFVAVLLLAFAALSASWILAHPITTPRDVLRVDYPVGAVNYMKENNLAGKVFNEFDWGGYLVWADPSCTTAIDGRTGVLLFPWGHMTAWKETVDLGPGWRERLEKGHPDFILINRDDYIVSQLLTEPGWKLLYMDHLAALFGRNQ
jgi:hypothetical protein